MSTLLMPQADRRTASAWRRVASASLLRWHLSSLDAPTVAVVWAIALLRLVGSRTRWQQALLLALGTWIVYVLDRVLDGAQFRPAEANQHSAAHLKDRHFFHLRHRRRLLWLCGVAALVVGWLCWQVPPRLVTFYLVLALPVTLYTVCVHWRLLGHTGKPAKPHPPSVTNSRPMKEAAVAVLFTTAVAGPACIDAQPGSRHALLLACLFLCLLCWLNCALISHVERASGTERADRDLAEQRALTGSAIVLAAAAGATLFHLVARSRGGTLCCKGAAALPAIGPGPVLAPFTPDLLPVVGAVLLSALLLLGLLLAGGNARRRRILADLGLLTPLLLLPLV